MEELEKNETSTQAEENTVSLASAQALADALAKIEVYTPTTWVDNSSPDIDAEHLNKPEQAIKRVTDALNSAVDVIKDLQSQVTKNSGAISDVNNNLSKFSAKSIGENYVMNYTDFSDSDTSIYGIASLADSPSGNAPDNNVGDFKILRLGTNSEKYNTLILTSPRYKSSASMSQKFYIGNFWDGIWMGWERLANKSALDSLTSAYNSTRTNYEKGSAFAEYIDSLSSPSQLTHAGFYKFSTITADVNADAGTETMTEYSVGDFYGLLLGGNINNTDGCEFGTLILVSPRIHTGIWICTIWQKKFIYWYKLNKA